MEEAGWNWTPISGVRTELHLLASRYWPGASSARPRLERLEAGCKQIGPRLKRAGMRWTIAGANAIIAPRCCLLSGRFEDSGSGEPQAPPEEASHNLSCTREAAPQ